MPRFRAWFRREELSRTALFMRGLALMFFPFAAMVFLAELLDHVRWTPPHGIVHTLFYAVLLLWYVLLTFVVTVALWFFGGLLRPLSWMTPVALLAILVTLAVLLLPVAAALMTFGELLSPGARLFGGT